MKYQTNTSDRLLWHTFFQFSGAGPYLCSESLNNLNDLWRKQYTDGVVKFIPWSYLIGCVFSILLYFLLNKLMRLRYQAFIIPVLKVLLLYTSFFLVGIYASYDEDMIFALETWEAFIFLGANFLQGVFSFWLLCSTTRFVFYFGRMEILLYMIGVFLPQIIADFVKFFLTTFELGVSDWLYQYLLFPTIIVMPICLVYYKFIQKYSQKIEDKFSNKRDINALLDSLILKENLKPNSPLKQPNYLSDCIKIQMLTPDNSDNIKKKASFYKTAFDKKALTEIIPESEGSLNNMITEVVFQKRSLASKSNPSLSKSSISTDHKKLRDKVKKALLLNKSPEITKRKATLACNAWYFLILYHGVFALFYVLIYTQLIGSIYAKPQYKSILEIIGICFLICGFFLANYLFPKLYKQKTKIIISGFIHNLATLALYIVYRLTQERFDDYVGVYIIVNFVQYSFGAGFYSMLILLFLMKIQFEIPDGCKMGQAKTDMGFLVVGTMYSGIAHAYFWNYMLFK